MKAERLLRLAEFLDTIPAERFDLSSWVGDGATACAMGFRSTMPEFGELGLKIAGRNWTIGPREFADRIRRFIKEFSE